MLQARFHFLADGFSNSRVSVAKYHPRWKDTTADEAHAAAHVGYRLLTWFYVL